MRLHSFLDLSNDQYLHKECIPHQLAHSPISLFNLKSSFLPTYSKSFSFTQAGLKVQQPNCTLFKPVLSTFTFLSIFSLKAQMCCPNGQKNLFIPNTYIWGHVPNTLFPFPIRAPHL